ncbi:hypothetical protein DYB37_009320 [Aphanomyces astaci]|uniref:Uncharacterized protein n=1 Tax=Aphanomyces astaci TaxID=112090 RepID=A0A397DLA0_APHAT|nr:hypothetical protein DYB36_003354 [Aphanomyces astaci]RHY55487.1 hypothetical protein DYB38_007729 [Aphanomyces astaci]RHY62240.1 hypothetical protein DYB34_007785 [Aphanomyces astaci]RHY64105.1 hypothetical protein DYB30_005872 [Aphanomyces astaci]RHY90890.1 hypothetical protein DYB35_009420 [Aphanomyces astaci]
MDLPVCPNLHSIAQTEVYRWLIIRKAYEARLEDECRRKNIQFPRTCNKLRGVALGQATAVYHDVDLEDPRRARYMSEQILKDKLQDIAKKPMNDVSPNLKNCSMISSSTCVKKMCPCVQRTT